MHDVYIHSGRLLASRTLRTNACIGVSLSRNFAAQWPGEWNSVSPMQYCAGGLWSQLLGSCIFVVSFQPILLKNLPCKDSAEPRNPSGSLFRNRRYVFPSLSEVAAHLWHCQRSLRSTKDDPWHFFIKEEALACLRSRARFTQSSPPASTDRDTCS